MQTQPLAPLVQDNISLADRAYDRLREAIVAGTLSSGTKLSERSLAAALAISAQPIREALRRLESEGMVETRPRSGTFVAHLDDARLYEMGYLRAVLEGASAALAARKAGPVEMAALQERLKAIRVATRHGDAAALAAANDAFHVTLHGITDNAFLIRSLQALRAYFHIGSQRVLASPDESRRALAEHAGIVAAVAAGDAAQAEALMRSHALRSLDVAFPQSTTRETPTMLPSQSAPAVAP